MNQTTIIIHWRGPYSTIEELEGEYGLYLLTGRCKGERDKQIQYCGITADSYYNRLSRHHRVGEIKRDLGIWLGQVAYPDDPCRDHLRLAERILVYFYQPNLNQQLKWYAPPPVSLISHWFYPDGSPRIRQLEIYRDLHDVICWDGYYWRSGNLSVYEDLAVY